MVLLLVVVEVQVLLVEMVQLRMAVMAVQD